MSTIVHVRQVGSQSNVHVDQIFVDFCHSKVWNLQAFKQFQFLSFNKQPKGFFSLVFKILHINFVNSLFFLTLICSFMYLITILLFLIEIKVIIEKSRGDVSLMEQDTIENISQPIKKLKSFFKTKCATKCIISFEVYDSFIGENILNL